MSNKKRSGLVMRIQDHIKIQFLKLELKILERIRRSKSPDDKGHLKMINLLQKYSNGDHFMHFDKILWRGGYNYTGDVTDPNSGGTAGDGVTFYEIYQACIEPFVKEDTLALEIGAGRGNWTKALLPAKEVWILEALSLRRNKIFDYLNYPKNLNYTQVHDFECNELPDDYFDFLFSYGCFCHLPYEGIVSYMTNCFPKMKEGGVGIVMISDWTKHPDFAGGIDRITGLNEENYKWYPGCWTPNNSKKMSALLSKIGWTVIDADYLKCKRDTLVYFKK